MGRPRKQPESVIEAEDIVLQVIGHEAKSYIIAAQFVDKDNFSKAYNIGDDIPASFTKERIESLLKLGLIKEK